MSRGKGNSRDGENELSNPSLSFDILQTNHTRNNFSSTLPTTLLDDNRSTHHSKNNTNSNNNNNNGNVFHSAEFPLPSTSRIHVPTYGDYHSTYYTNMQQVSNKATSELNIVTQAAHLSSHRNRYGYNYSNNNNNHNNRPLTNPQVSQGIVFRSADSTQRAMNELTQRRYEAMQRKRACILFSCLLVLASSIYYVANVNYNIGINMYQHGEINNGDGTINNDIDGSATNSLSSFNDGGIVSNGGQQGQEGGGMLDGESGGMVEAPPQEEMIEEGKEFLKPYRYFADLKTPSRSSDNNFFFHIPRSGGQTVKDIIGKCLGKTLASEVGVRDGHGEDQTLQVVDVNGANYVNVDTTSVDGLHRAAALGLAPSGLSDVITSSYFAEVGMLYDLYHKGRAFVLLRDPMVRAVSMYYYKTQGDVVMIDPSVTLEDYAQGNGIENNWVTRFLTGRMEGELMKEDLEQAKEIIKRKFLIGFIDDGEETVYRLMKYFGFSFDEDETRKMEQEDCIKDLLKEGTNHNNVSYEMPKKGSQAAALIKWQTQFDIKLFDFARELFDAQTKEYGSKERKKELKKRKKDGN